MKEETIIFDEQASVELSTKVELVTPELAQKYLERNTINRPINKSRVQYYAEQMRKGQWLLNGEAICFVRGGALANGQHRLHAVIESHTPTHFLIVRNCDPNSFVVYDSGKNRSISDVFSIEGIPNAVNVSAIINKYLLLSFKRSGFTKGGAYDRATGMSTKQFGKRTPSKQDVLNIYEESPETFQDIRNFCYALYRKVRMFSVSEMGGIVAYLIKDLRHSEESVKDFFNQLYENTPYTNDTVRLLREKLIKNAFGSVKMSSEYKSRIIIKAWNAYVRGKELKVLVWDKGREGDIWFI